jgi:hypothetical protein
MFFYVAQRGASVDDRRKVLYAEDGLTISVSEEGSPIFFSVEAASSALALKGLEVINSDLLIGPACWETATVRNAQHTLTISGTRADTRILLRFNGGVSAGYDGNGPQTAAKLLASLGFGGYNQLFAVLSRLNLRGEYTFNLQ